MKIDINKLEKKLGGLKFAVVIISIFSLSMIVGTFLESYYGTEFAGRVIYKTIPFMALQFLMFISIYFAAMLRLPPKKRLYGFYTIHTGLIIVGIGSFITYYAGVDGNIDLSPNTPNRKIILPEDQVQIILPSRGKRATFNLPESAFSSSIDKKYEEFHFKKYLPYSVNKLEWKDSREKISYDSHSSQYLIYNDNVDQKFTLSLHPEADDFESSMKLGPLSIVYLPASLAKCFGSNTKSKLVFWNSRESTCFTPEQRGVITKKTKDGKNFVVLKHKDEYLSFFPDVSPYPLDINLKNFKNSDIKVFNKKIFESNPTLFLFGKKVAFFIKDESTWKTLDFEHNKEIELPWMGFKLQNTYHTDSLVPTNIPYYTIPIQKNGKIIKGDQKAIEVEINGKTFWVTNHSPLKIKIADETAMIYITKKTLNLPFELILTKFKMDKDPGTNTPASYESFVQVFTNDGPIDAHVYMNNPLKHEGFTFYQASYYQDEQGSYHSTLSANVDQGRFLKYLGSLLLVLGAILHYQLNKKKIKKKLSNQNKVQA